MTPQHHPDPPAGSWFSPKIEAGHIIQAGLVVVGIITWALTSRNNADNAQRDIARLEASSNSAVASLRADMSIEFEKLHASQDKLRDELLREIHTNPVVDQHFQNIERWISSQERYDHDNDARMSDMAASDAHTRADLDALMRASNAPIRNAR